MEQKFDLWGDPIPEPTERRGRPAHVVTDEKRLRVSVLRALDQSNEQIAAAMGISERTLRAKYLPELKHGLAQKRAELLILIWAQAKKGNVAAMKEFSRQIDRSDLNGGPRIQRPASTPKLGKKEQAKLDAATPDPGTSMGDLIAQRNAGLVRH